MADQTEQMNRLLDPNSAVREGEMNYSYQVDDRIEQPLIVHISSIMYIMGNNFHLSAQGID
jgi:hypothetical protein